MSRYHQLSMGERCSIARLHEDGQSIRQIAATLDRRPSTIARELKRNAVAKQGYRPAYAQAQADARRYTERLSIHDRPDRVANRRQPGHWEAGAMIFSTPGQAILIAHERHSRITIALRQSSLKVDPVVDALVAMLHAMPNTLRRSITFDNGTEFNHHQRIASQLELDDCFCDPRAPWQKGGIENAIGRLRRNLPRKTKLDDLSPNNIDVIIANYNNTPRKCLGFLTPAEIFNPLHFKCESTPGSSPG